MSANSWGRKFRSITDMRDPRIDSIFNIGELIK